MTIRTRPPGMPPGSKTRPVFLGGCLLVLALGAPAASAQEQLGILFTSPEEREYLDYLRAEFLEENQQDDFNIEEAPPPIPVQEEEEEDNTPAHYELGGIIARQDGSRVVWLNGSSRAESALPGNMDIRETANGLALSITLEQQNYLLRSGQTLDVNSGRILEAYQSLPDAPAEAENTDAESTDETDEPAAADNETEQNNNGNNGGGPLPPDIDTADLEGADPQALAELIEALQSIQAQQQQEGNDADNAQ